MTAERLVEEVRERLGTRAERGDSAAETGSPVAAYVCRPKPADLGQAGALPNHFGFASESFLTVPLGLYRLYGIYMHPRLRLARVVSTCCSAGAVALLLSLWLLPRHAAAQAVAGGDSTGGWPTPQAARNAARKAARSDTTKTAPWRVGAFVGIARNSPSRRFLGSTAGFDHLFLGLEALTPVLRLGPVQVSYGVQLLPLVRASGSIEHVEVVYDSGVVALAARRTRVVQVPVTAYAFGLSPFGLQIAAPLASAVSLYAATAAGGLIFDRPFPTARARRVNFTLEFGGGVLVRVAREQWVRVGYKYHHLSNAYTAPENPGLDGNVFYAGYDWSIRLPR